ncbi:putative MFS-type transporter [Lachnellula subtilissima]|uniref:Putative MFS-type transporter n=1 Tax=Lachnellula subtilissima TaxID=602034 RepID=A0A8H8UAZ6_9HELO|nr:putative MFS-type transporter [Lachnellula subtilissima]
MATTILTTTTLEITPLPIITPPHPTETAEITCRSREDGEQREGRGDLPKRRAAVIIISVAGVNFLNTLGSGILTVALPRMLLAFKALQGISISLCLTTAVGILSSAFSAGTTRNIAFSGMGAASPVGYSAGLVLGGVFVEGPGWRWSFYLAAILNRFWGVPNDRLEVDADVDGVRGRGVWGRLREEVDWVGAGVATVGISLVSYVMAVLTGSSASIKEVTNIVLLTIGLLLLPAFVFWMSFQERRGRPAIIPNSIWKQSAFTTSCISVFLTWGAFNAFGYSATLFFQEIQVLSALQTSVRLLPTVVCGILTNVATGFLVKNTSANYLVAVSSIFSAVGALLMALVKPDWTFWACAFPAIFLSPMSSDGIRFFSFSPALLPFTTTQHMLYTISNLIIADAFPASKQSLAGGVFNTVSQIGNSVGLTVGAVIASSVSSGEVSIEAMEKGYKATFYACFAAMVLVGIVSGAGLRRAGKRCDCTTLALRCTAYDFGGKRTGRRTPVDGEPRGAFSMSYSGLADRSI